MFGYINPLKSELKIREYDYFKSYYCGLCYSIKENFGNIPRFTLNYDLTFIGFLLDGLTESPINLKKVRCIKHPRKELLICSKTDALDYVSNLCILLFNLKLEDDISDENNLKSKVLYLFLNHNNESIKDKYYDMKFVIKDEINKLTTLEKTKEFKSLDEISHPFSHIMGMILKIYPYQFDNDSIIVRDNLYKMGYLIGKWIYLMDALDDLQSDMLKNQFNPYLVLYNGDNSDYKNLINKIIYDIEFNILSTISACSDYLGKIEFKKHKEILKNIIELGMINKYYEILLKIQNSLKEEDV